MTLSQIRNRIQALQLKYAKELAVYRLRRQAEEICDQWERAGGDRQDPPQPEATRPSNENPSFLRRQEPLSLCTSNPTQVTTTTEKRSAQRHFSTIAAPRPATKRVKTGQNGAETKFLPSPSGGGAGGEGNPVLPASAGTLPVAKCNRPAEPTSRADMALRNSYNPSGALPFTVCIPLHGKEPTWKKCP